jgi:hypothetical protein
MQKVSETLGGFFESNHEGGAFELLVGEIQEGNDTER